MFSPRETLSALTSLPVLKKHRKGAKWEVSDLLLLEMRDAVNRRAIAKIYVIERDADLLNSSKSGDLRNVTFTFIDYALP